MNLLLLIDPSILSADFGNLKVEMARIEAAGADWVHVDVMDGHFVPNLTSGPPVAEALRTVTSLPFDVHLMVTDPDLFIPEFVKAGANSLTVHMEICQHLQRTIHLIKEHRVRGRVTLNLARLLLTIEEIITEVDLVLVMSVNPGFGWQEFIPQSSTRYNAHVNSIQELEVVCPTGSGWGRQGGNHG